VSTQAEEEAKAAIKDADETPALELAQRLVKLLEAQEHGRERLAEAMRVVDKIRATAEMHDAEIVAIQRELAKGVKGKRASTPTHAGTSRPGFRVQVREPLKKALNAEYPAWATPIELCNAAGITCQNLKIAVRQILLVMNKKGLVERQSRDTNLGRTLFEYRLVRSES